MKKPGSEFKLEQTSLYENLSNLKHQRIEQQSEKIAEILLLTGNLNPSCGLLHGRIGIAIFFFHYARYTGNRLFETVGVDLAHSVSEQIERTKIPDII